MIATTNKPTSLVIDLNEKIYKIIEIKFYDLISNY